METRNLALEAEVSASSVGDFILRISGGGLDGMEPKVNLANNMSSSTSLSASDWPLMSQITSNDDAYYIFCNHSSCMELIEGANGLAGDGSEFGAGVYAHYAQAQVVTDFDVKFFLGFRCFMSWLSLFFICIGLVGNLVSFVILINPKMRISTNVFLASLCVSGFIALLGLLTNSVIYDLFYYYAFSDGLNYVYMFYPYVYPIITTFQMSSIMLTVCVSLNQFIYIYFSGTQQRNQKKSDKECRRALKVVINLS